MDCSLSHPWLSHWQRNCLKLSHPWLYHPRLSRGQGKLYLTLYHWEGNFKKFLKLSQLLSHPWLSHWKGNSKECLKLSHPLSHCQGNWKRFTLTFTLLFSLSLAVLRFIFNFQLSTFNLKFLTFIFLLPLREKRHPWLSPWEGKWGPSEDFHSSTIPFHFSTALITSPHPI